MTGTGKEERKIRSLRDLPRNIEPRRDLWPGIEARLAAEPRGIAEGTAGDGVATGAAADIGAGAGPGAGGIPDAAGGTRPDAPGRVRWGTDWTRRRHTLRVFAAAAMIAALAVGIWIGRTVLPSAGGPAAGSAITANVPTNQGEAIQAAFMKDPRYARDRAALVKSLEAQLDSLPPDSRAKVMSSLSTIQDSIRDLESALGRDPTNALLQELLVNTYQDEMRVLTAVHEAGDTGKGI
jgi:hypothetical protein